MPKCAILRVLQMFGPYAAVMLAEMSEGLVLDCLSQLDNCLARWKELLDPVTMAVVVGALVCNGSVPYSYWLQSRVTYVSLSAGLGLHYLHPCSA